MLMTHSLTVATSAPALAKLVGDEVKEPQKMSGRCGCSPH